LFEASNRFVVIYASNADAAWTSPHVRHRRFTDYVQNHCPNWRLVAHCPNPYPFNPNLPDDTSFADFFVFTRAREACTVMVPAYD
jgi:hypothetical protein